MARVLNDLSLNAEKLAAERTEKFASRVIEHFQSRPELFEAFGQPDFQFSLQDAGRVAASSDEEQTEQLLVDLLANRAEAGGGARAKLATSQAIKVVDMLSPEILTGITALWTVLFRRPNAQDFSGRVTFVARTTEDLVEMGLPQSQAWFHDSDALNLLRSLGGIVARMSYREMIERKLEAHFVTGLDPAAVAELLNEAEVLAPGFQGRLRPHPLKPGFVTLPSASREDFLATFSSEVANSDVMQQLASQNGFGGRDPETNKAIEEIMAHPPITTFAQWWDALPAGEPTVTGEVVGLINAQRLSLTQKQTVGEFLGV